MNERSIFLEALDKDDPTQRSAFLDTACAGDAAFAYVDAHAEHANIGFFFGAFLDDPTGLLEGAGKRMRHVKLRVERMPDEGALGDLITAAYRDIRRRLDDARP